MLAPQTAFAQNAKGISQTATFDAYDSGTTVAPRPPRAVIRLLSILHLVDSVSFVQMAVVTDASLRTSHRCGVLEVNLVTFWFSVDMLSLIIVIIALLEPPTLTTQSFDIVCFLISLQLSNGLMLTIFC